MTGTPDAIDALLGPGPRRAVPLPSPAERERLRGAYGLTKTETAKALGVSSTTFGAWEAGRREPQGEARVAYARLLDGIAARLAETSPTEAPPAGASLADDSLTDTSPAEPLTAPQQAPASPPPPGVALLDETPQGELVLEAPAPCIRCGRPTPYRSGGRPLHAGDWCTPTPQPQDPTEPATEAATAAPTPAEAPPAQPPAPSPAPLQAPQAPRRQATRPAAPRQPPARPRRAPAKAAPAPDWEQAAAARFPTGPLAVIDVAPDGRELLEYLVDGSAHPVPARTLPALVGWALEAGLGSPRLHRYGKDGDPLLVLTDAAATELGLPPAGKDEKKDYVPRLGRLAAGHRVVKALARGGWQLTQRGLGPWARVYREPTGGRRECVQLCVPMWGALELGGWQFPAGLGAGDLARLLGAYATRVITPRGSTAVSGLELMTALRPPTRAVRTESGWVSAPVDGSLHQAVDAAPPEVPAEHPLAEGRGSEADQVLAEEAWDWFRPLDQVEDAERAQPYAVGLDVNTAFLAAAGRLVVGLSEPLHAQRPAFDRKVPGCWLVDLSGLDLDPRLPNPFTPSGEPPRGPAWYATPTLAYAAELGATVEPLEGWLRHEAGPYLDPWHRRLRDAYLTTMERLGVPLDLADRDPQAFLAAMARLGEAGDPAELAVLSAIKATAKGGIGKLREKPRQGWQPGQRWAALERPTWRPDIRAAVIATARVNFHRKLRRTAETTGRYPLGVLSDCAVYAAPGPSALDVLPHDPAAAPAPGALRLGVSPGFVKFEGARPLPEVLALLAEQANPARHIKTGGAVSADE
ncbi:telomere-associated protein Tap [Kitasatospora sp. LaBMicrA B282]|uniref:telomere-associated protein Tap n=1 Tax=Kitasatospora sp. LaBMicrA B282 TaxID=3420949 RepID=UPI003D09A4E0